MSNNTVPMNNLPHFVGEVEGYQEAGLQKYVTFCCMKIDDYDFTKGPEYVGTFQGIVSRGKNIRIKLLKYSPTLAEAQGCRKLLMENQGSAESSPWLAKLDSLEGEVKTQGSSLIEKLNNKMDEGIQIIKDHLQVLEKKVEAQLEVIQKEIEDIKNDKEKPKESPEKAKDAPEKVIEDTQNKENEKMVFDFGADGRITQQDFAKAIKSRMQKQGFVDMLKRCKVWPTPVLSIVNLPKEKQDQLTEVLETFTFKALQAKSETPISVHSQEFKDLHKTFREHMISRLWNESPKMPPVNRGISILAHPPPKCMKVEDDSDSDYEPVVVNRSSRKKDFYQIVSDEDSDSSVVLTRERKRRRQSGKLQ